MYVSGYGAKDRQLENVDPFYTLRRAEVFMNETEICTEIYDKQPGSHKVSEKGKQKNKAIDFYLLPV